MSENITKTMTETMHYLLCKGIEINPVTESTHDITALINEFEEESVNRGLHEKIVDRPSIDTMARDKEGKLVFLGAKGGLHQWVKSFSQSA